MSEARKRAETLAEDLGVRTHTNCDDSCPHHDMAVKLILEAFEERYQAGRKDGIAEEQREVREAMRRGEL